MSNAPFRTHVLSYSGKARSCLLYGWVALGLAAIGCGSAAEEHARDGSLASLGFDETTLHSDGTPRFLSGRLISNVKDGRAAASLILAQLGPSYRLAKETSFAVKTDTRDDDGRRYFRLQQQHAGLRVVGREVALQVGSDGAIEAILGQLAPDLRLDLLPAMSGDEAIETALATLARGQARVLRAPELSVYLEKDSPTPHLAYGALVEYFGDHGHTIEEVYAAATDGAVLGRHPRIYRAGLDRKIYDLQGDCIRDGSELPGTLALGEGGKAMEPPQQRAYDNSGNVYWYYKHMFGRSSYDDSDATLVSTVNVTFDTGMGGCDGGNAAWIPDPFNQMVYGTGSLSGLLLKEMTLGFDVAAHEMSHAVTYATSNLEYLNEAGALNEANSDIMGATAEAWLNSGGSKMGNPTSITLTDKTWKIGEDVAGLILPGGALRFMNNPTADKMSKDYYAERYIGSDDNGGVHINSGIANLAFYLLVSGGSHPRGKTPGIVVTGLGIDKAARIFYLANTRLYTATSEFKDARYATARIAENLYGRCSVEWQNVHRAWDAVGVPGVWTLCIKPPSGF